MVRTRPTQLTFGVIPKPSETPEEACMRLFGCPLTPSLRAAFEKAKHLQLEFGVVPKPSEYLPKRIDTMYRVYGKTPGKTCKTCEHCTYTQLSKRYYKCELSKVSSSAATDWRVGWEACGKYEEEK